MNRTVTRTDETGRDLGQVDILEAHTGEGILHYAFSVYVFSEDRQEMLIQRRSNEKMLWPLSWANTCCSHPYEGEVPATAGNRRLKEELGCSCDLVEGPVFTYKAEDPAGRGVEHEYVRILVGTMPKTAVILPDPKEVDEWKWVDIAVLRKDMSEHPDLYTPWFHTGLRLLLD